MSTAPTTGERIGRGVGIGVFSMLVLALLGLVLWPKAVGAVIAQSTWSEQEKAACDATPGCVVNLVAGGVTPVAWAIAWVVLIGAAVVVCWLPTRWWSSRGRGPVEIIADSSPRWLRLHAFVAAFVCLLLIAPGRSNSTTWALEYLIPAVLALGVAGLATLSLRHARAALGPAAFAERAGTSLFSDRVARTRDRASARTKDAAP